MNTVDNTEYADLPAEDAEVTATPKPVSLKQGDIHILEAMKQNRHARRRLAKLNGLTKIPAFTNVIKRAEELNEQ